ncbi:uncharacterized protein I303_107176 [Kwoniella dejecticola CBS 10117]|uniref:RanBP2-type domain-containing protein n=1 Tax=Kwoniella dejecticola CBS 10117 TaxID=1296121 RepID=A0A1A5ZYY3_9TREE|nr:uncharacterized protein I303_06578 [Kwoniella dejecticola CBS 10117]OBR83019.1 hypothetical protein I303_06578 [Kwoniella dejecticola CBS 10117]
MERSSSQRDLRAERIARTPYNRPEPSRLRKSASITPLATLKSIVSYVSSPFTKSSSSVLPTHSNDAPTPLRITEGDQDTKSESGSEDEWNGQPPSQMDGQDMFTLAAAAGRSGADFDTRASDWRAKEIPGGRRQTARLGLEASSNSHVILEPPTPTAPGHFTLNHNHIRPSPSMPTLTAKSPSTHSQYILPSKIKTMDATTLSRGKLPQRSPLPPSSTPQPQPPLAPQQIEGLSSSASSVALTAFLEAKKGQHMTSDDFRVIESLTENMKSESQFGGSPTKSDFSHNYTQSKDRSRGGWAAGSYPWSIRSSNSFASLSTPQKSRDSGNQASTPGKVFAVGTQSSSTGGSPYRQRYLGPGMSPRRMLPQPKKSSLKPLFNFGNADFEDQLNGKKRKVDDEQENGMDVDFSTSISPSRIPGSSLSSSISMPALAVYDKGTQKLPISSRTPARPSPLSRNASEPSSAHDDETKKKQEAEIAGKKRAAEIIMDIIDAEIGPVIPTRKAEPVIFNPYDRTSLNPTPIPAVPPTQPSTAFAGSTPRKSLGRSVNGGSPARRTPTRGAAAKLESNREAMKGSKPLTTIERIQGVRPWEKPGGSLRSSSRVDTPTPTDDDIMEIDELFDESQASSSRAPSPPPSISAKAPAPTSSLGTASSSMKIPQAETFKPFTTPSITFNNQPLPKSPAITPSGSAEANANAFDSPLRNSIIASSSDNASSIPKPTFAFGKPSTTPIPNEDNESIDDKRSKSPEKAQPAKLDTSKIYLSAKDSALKIAQPALPFFTFTLPRPLESTASSNSQAAALEEAKKRELRSFQFTLPSPSESDMAPQAEAEEKDWKCGLCGLMSPASAKEKCTVCEEPRPKSTTSGSTSTSAPSFGFGFGQTTTNLPSSAPKQGFSFGSSSASTASSTLIGGSTGSGASEGQWTCDTCMLKSPESAKEKCTVCEAPRPAPKPQFSTSASGTGGFSGFGGLGGLAAPSKPMFGAGEWECGTCMLKNPDSAKEKCTVCDAPRR